MNFYLQRLSHDDNQTFGYVCNADRSYQAHTLEDEPRSLDQKVKGETRILAGLYELVLNKADTPLTLKHRETYNKKAYGEPWFTWHIMLKDVKGFSGIYIHSGIDEKHTDGCLLFAHGCDYSKDRNPMFSSLDAIREFYLLVQPLLEKGEKCYIQIFDEINFPK